MGGFLIFFSNKKVFLRQKFSFHKQKRKKKKKPQTPLLYFGEKSFKKKKYPIFFPYV